MIDRRTLSGLSPDVKGYCYEDAAHFDRCMKPAALRFGQAVWVMWLMLAGGLVLILAATIALNAWVDPRFGFVAFLAIPLWTSWVFARRRRFITVVLARRLCLQCGYELTRTPVDEAGWGVCSECGRAFNLCEYRRPPKRYVRPPSLPRLKREWE